jgi:hypothetical protein
VELPASWTLTDDDADLVLASVVRGGDDYAVECRRLDGRWSATVTRVREGQRHRVATVVRPDLPAAVDAVDHLF